MTVERSPSRVELAQALRRVIDPEVGLDIVSLGLVHAIDVRDGEVNVAMTMTTAACPMGEQIVRDAEAQLAEVEGVGEVAVELVWEPPWAPEHMSDEAMDALGWYG